MKATHRILAFAFTVASLSACDRTKGYDQMNLRTEEVGEALPTFVAKRPANVGEITTWRTTFPGQIFAAVKLKVRCPHDIHTFAGVQYKKDKIELCFSATPRSDPVPGFACAEETYVKYEIMGMPADVDPKFVFVGGCF